MSKEEIANALAVIMSVMTADERPAQDQVDAAGAAGLGLGAQLISDLHRSANALERIAGAMERIADAPSQTVIVEGERPVRVARG